ncbi:hypothetical protein pb186bvf_002374 [Paramecium bursaria]
MNDLKNIDYRLNNYLQKRSNPDYQQECGMLVKDKAQLLNELDQLRARNIVLENELRELIRNYDDIQHEEEQNRFKNERFRMLEDENQSLKLLNERTKNEYKIQIELLQRELDLTILEKNKLLEENIQLKGQQDKDDLYKK